MSRKTFIQWCHSTWSPWLGCSKVSPGCKNCYIVTTTPFRTRKLKHGEPRQRTAAGYWKQPLKWNREAVAPETRQWRCPKCGAVFGNVTSVCPTMDCLTLGQEFELQRPRIFPSLCDWLDDEVPIEWLADFLKLIHDTANLDWLLLTKRPENFFDRIESVLASDSFRCSAVPSSNPDEKIRREEYGWWLANWQDRHIVPPNVWIGTSVEDQQRADERIPELLKIPARVRFLSVEPLLGPVDLKWNKRYPQDACIGPKINWVIVGGESGPKARACNIEWIRSIVAECKAAGVPCFVKQLGAMPHQNDQILNMKDPKGGDISEWPFHLRVREFPKQ